MIHKWKDKKILQQPNWDSKDLIPILKQIKDYPNLVSIQEIKILKKHLSNVAQGNGFIIQGGDCAETFIDFNADMIENKLKTLLQMSAIIQYITKTNIIRIGRIAGQFFKPRTNTFEIRDNMKLPVYRGDGINSIEFSKDGRTHNPKRLLQAYHQSAATMNLIRNLMMEGFTDLSNIQSWSIPLIEKSFLDCLNCKIEVELVEGELSESKKKKTNENEKDHPLFMNVLNKFKGEVLR